MTAGTGGTAAPGCGCPQRNGNTYHQRDTCTDPVVAKLGWYADDIARDVATAPEGTAPGQAVAPGQAFRDALRERWIARGRSVDSRSYESLPQQERDDLEFAAQAAVAAFASVAPPQLVDALDAIRDGRPPAVAAAAAAQPAPGGEVERPALRITDCGTHDGASHIQVSTGDNWLCVVALAPILAEYEPQPGQPAPAAADAALERTYRQAAEAERDRLRDGIKHEIRQLEQSAAATMPSKKSAIEAGLAERLAAWLEGP